MPRSATARLDRSRGRWRTWRSGLAIGVLLTGTQLSLVLWTAPRAPGESVSSTWERLCTWDCAWYTEIARNGYRSTVPPVRQSKTEANVAFFPLYPWLGRLLYLGAGVEPRYGLLAVAQLCSILFWASLWSWARRWRIPRFEAALLLWVILAHPASFFLVSGYSESVFLSALVLYFFSAGRRIPRLGAVAPGWMMSATRLVGVPAAAYPVFALLLRRWAGGRRARAAAVAWGITLGLLACAGAGLFFAYCKRRFGSFDLYFETQRIGWGVVADSSALWDWSSWRFSYAIDRVATWASLWAFGGLVLIEFALGLATRAGWTPGAERTTSGWQRRAPVHLAALVIFAITLCGLKSVQFRSMIRYSLAWTLLLALCLADISARLRQGSRSMRVAGRMVSLILLSGALASLIGVQVPHLRDFLRGIWFA